MVPTVFDHPSRLFGPDRPAGIPGALLFLVLAGLLWFPSLCLAESVQAVWAGRQDKGFDLYVSPWENGAWGKTERIVASPEDDITPAMVMDRRGRNWVVWNTRDKDGRSQLRYQVRQAEKMLLSGAIKTGSENNYAPSLLIDGEDRAWAAWSSLEDEDEDIYASRFDGKAWSDPVRVNSNDDQPDILPILAVDDDGVIVVSWESLEQDGYERFQARWEGERFGGERMVQNRPWILRHTQHLDKAWLKLPSAASQYGMAAISARAATGIQSVPQSILQILQQSAQEEKKP